MLAHLPPIRSDIRFFFMRSSGPAGAPGPNGRIDMWTIVGPGAGSADGLNMGKFSPVHGGPFVNSRFVSSNNLAQRTFKRVFIL